MSHDVGHKVLFAPVGSLGDLFPMLGIARALRAAGATCDFASGLEHKTLIERDGFCFEEVPITTKGRYAEANLRFANSPDGGASLWREVLLPQLAGGIDALVPLIRNHDVVVGGFVSLCVPAAAEIAGKPWVSLQLTGLPFMSAMDPPVHPAAASSLWARGRAPLVWQVARTVALSGVPRQMMREAGAVLMEERARRGLEPGDGDVMLETVSPFLTLGMFPKQLWPPQQADWPPSAVPLGPVTYEGGGPAAPGSSSIEQEDQSHLLTRELQEFLSGCAERGAAADAGAASGGRQQADPCKTRSGGGAAGGATAAAAPATADDHTGSGARPSAVLAPCAKKPLVVFALGSVAVESAASLAGCFASAAKAVGMRALIVAGEQCDAASAAATAGTAVTVGLRGDWDVARDVVCIPSAPYSVLFRHASVVVHQGGAGTTARALCAGVPTVILPLGMDTWDNALRAERAGTSVTVPREGMTAGGLSAAILKAANDKTVKDAALKVGADATRDAKLAVSAAAEAILRLVGSLSAVTRLSPASTGFLSVKPIGEVQVADEHGDDTVVAFLAAVTVTDSKPAAASGRGRGSSETMMIFRPRQSSAGPDPNAAASDPACAAEVAAAEAMANNQHALVSSACAAAV